MPRNHAPFLSLSMIVKDEEAFIEQCLASVRDLVDEMVVYDTGSTDRTIELAEASGATVIRGYWDDDFARARNHALRACQGTWVLSLDADEVLMGAGAELREHLRSNPRLDAVAVPIHNVGTPAGDFEHHALRAFRRSRMRWVGRLHEQLERRDGARPHHGRAPGVLIEHYGYSAAIATARDKHERNLRIAIDALDGSEARAPDGLLLFNVARAYAQAGQLAAASDHFDRAARVTEGATHIAVLRFGTEVLRQQQRFGEALRWCDRYQTVSQSVMVAEFIRGHVEFSSSGDGRRLTQLDLDGDLADGSNFFISPAHVHRTVADAHASAGDWNAAAEVLTAAIEAYDAIELWGDAALATHRSGRELGPLVSRIPASQLVPAIKQFMALDPAVREVVAQALVRTLGAEHPHVFAFIAVHARGLGSVQDMVPWATLIRQSTYEAPCPVLARATDASIPVTQRFLAAATAHAAFQDLRALELLFELTDVLGPEDEADAALILSEIAPDLLVS